MKKILILFSFILLLSGCYDYVEIDDLVIISGMLIDYKDNQYEINSQIIENNNETKIKVYKTKCKSIDECIFEISKLSNKDIFISHMKTLILTESAIKNNDNYIDYFLRDTKSKMNFYIYYTDDKYKEDILNIYKNEGGSAFYIKDLMKYNNKIFSSSTPLSFLDFVYKKTEYGIDPIYPNLKIIENNNEKVLYLDGLISFNKNKLTLNDEQSIMYNILTNNLVKTIITIPCDNNNYSLVLEKTTNKKEVKNNTFNNNISINAKLSSYNCKYDLDDPKTINKLSNITNKYIKDKMEELIDLSISNDIDFLGISSYIYKHENKKIDFKKVNINTNVSTTIDSIGEIR